MHPGCAADRKDEEGAGTTWFWLSRIADDLMAMKELPNIDQGTVWEQCGSDYK
jgi:hypothetical protein